MEAGSMLQFIRFPESELKVRPKFKKGVKRGPFFFFMEEKKEEWKAEGRWDSTCTRTDLALACKPAWDLLSTNPDLLEPYKKKANEYSKAMRDDMEKLDCLGRPMRVLQLEAERIEKKWLDMEAEIRSTVKNISERKLLKKTFFIAHFNHMCEARGNFPPCEASIVKFSLQEGLKDTWQEFVSPLDSVPVGYKFKCIQRARETHCLGLDFTQYRENMQEILDEILGFLQSESGGEAGSLPPLYVGKGDVEVAEYISNFIITRAGSAVELKIFPIHKLLQELIMHSDSALAENLMEKDTYSHHPGLGCGIHESLGRGYFCSLSICKRLLFTLLSATSRCREFEMRAGTHYPSPSEGVPRGMEMDITALRLEYEDRINRKIPHPAGIWKNVEPEEEEEDDEDKESRRSVVKNWTVPSQAAQEDGGAVGGLGVSVFPSTDIRDRFKVIQTRPRLVKAKKNFPEDENNNVGQ